jgi:hypothetical protein
MPRGRGAARPSHPGTSWARLVAHRSLGWAEGNKKFVFGYLKGVCVVAITVLKAPLGLAREERPNRLFSLGQALGRQKSTMSLCAHPTARSREKPKSGWRCVRKVGGHLPLLVTTSISPRQKASFHTFDTGGGVGNSGMYFESVTSSSYGG